MRVVKNIFFKGSTNYIHKITIMYYMYGTNLVKRPASKYYLLIKAKGRKCDI